MRDIFSEIFSSEPAEPLDPVAAARRAVRPQLRRRFYRHAQVGEGADGFAIQLDDKPVRTPAQRLLAAPRRALADAIAAEWEAQSKFIDPVAMPLTRLANSIIDGVAGACAAVATEVEKYLSSDLVFYRAESPEGLIALQARHWDPLLEWARDFLGADFVPATGVMHVLQPESAIAAARRKFPGDAWPLGALHSVTTLSGSALIALALMHGRLSADEAWAAAHVDEDWQMEKWGRDALGLERRVFRFKDFQAAALVLAVLTS